MIYIVEDDASIRELEQYALQTNQYTVRGFEDGASFWAAVRETVPDLVILDVMLPDEDGYQILSKLRDDPATQTLPVIMVTANQGRRHQAYAESLGVGAYFLKPVPLQRLVAKAVELIAADPPSRG